MKLFTPISVLGEVSAICFDGKRHSIEELHTPARSVSWPKKFMDAGKLVPDALLIDIIKDRLAKPDVEAGWMLDGFPRTMPQAEGYASAARHITLLSISPRWKESAMLAAQISTRGQMTPRPRSSRG